MNSWGDMEAVTVARFILGVLAGFASAVFLVATVAVLVNASSIGPLIGAVVFGVVAALLLTPVFRNLPATWSQRELGKIGATMVRLVHRGNRGELDDYLWKVLPAWPVRDLIHATAVALLEIRTNAPLARQAGVPDAITDQLAAEAEHAAEALGPIADRIVAVAEQKISRRHIHAAIQRETNAVQHLLDSAKSARASLAVLTLSGGSDPDLEDARVRLNAMGEVARELITWNERT